MNSPNSRDLATPMVGVSSSQPRWHARPKRLGWARPWPSASSRSGIAGERRQRVEHRGDLAKRQQPRHVGKCGRPPRQRELDQLQIGELQHRDRGAGHAAPVLEADVDPGDQVGRAQPIAHLGLAGQASWSARAAAGVRSQALAWTGLSGTAAARRRA